MRYKCSLWAYTHTNKTRGCRLDFTGGQTRAVNGELKMRFTRVFWSGHQVSYVFWSWNQVSSLDSLEYLLLYISTGWDPPTLKEPQHGAHFLQVREYLFIRLVYTYKNRFSKSGRSSLVPPITQSCFEDMIQIDLSKHYVELTRKDLLLNTAVKSGSSGDILHCNK